MPKPYHIDKAVAHARSVKGGKARHAPAAYIRGLARAKLTDADLAALAALLAAALARPSAGDGGELLTADDDAEPAGAR